MVEVDFVYEVLVFKTDLDLSKEYVIRQLLSVFAEIEAVDFDFEDCDNILRVEALKDIAPEIEVLLNSKGFYCEEIQ
ncbi:hypothetical protein GWK08_03305 [Leptobacterium flavescens]|uniref:Methyltransferase type 11 n=1 Tax=Leptobacterium flavescens TaxID=472055 RepID=A0A6P0UGT0_9FLAO|nr:hypothetical protein [Leptobacterium flavescens]NER12455.1 hypothetical protein [Leptobacterium flavescens]